MASNCCFMDNLLLKYMGEGLSRDPSRASQAIKPIVTISREYGCPSKPIAQLLTDTINKKLPEGSHLKWRFINKEVLESAARELQLNPADVKYLLSVGEKSLMEDFLVSFSSTYVSNLNVNHTLTKVVSTIAQSGHVVLVGRGSAAILQGKPRSLHVRLMAPEAWRLQAVISSRNISSAEAKHLIETTDKKRSALYELILGQKMNPYIFDVAFNCSTLSKHQIVEGILSMMAAREMI